MRNPSFGTARFVFLAASALIAAACGAQSVTPSDVTVVHVDAATDHARPDVPPAGCTSNAQCDDMSFCNGAATCVAGVCQPGQPPCDDGVTCTTDTCDESSHACGHTPSDGACSDGMACNGSERCAPGAMGANPMTGCLPPGSGSLDCDDGNVCTIDTCSDMTGGCVHSGRDLDGDGHIDAMCGGDDCDDANANVHPGARENCTNGIDDDCNGFVDAADPACMMVSPGGTCATAIVLPGPGVYSGTTTGTGTGFGAICPTTAGAGPVAVMQFTLTATTDVVANVISSAGPINFAIATSCAPFVQTACNGARVFPPSGLIVAAILGPGTYWIAVQTETPAPYLFSLGFAAVTTDTTYALTQPVIPFVDVCAIPGHGTALATQDDSTVQLPTITDVAPATVPFPLRMYDVAATLPLSVCSNGWISLLPTTAIEFTPMLPSSSAPNLTIAALWEDLFTRDPGVCYATVGAAPNRRFVVEWADAALYADRMANATFEIAIDEAPAGQNNVLEVVYQHTDGMMVTHAEGVEDATGATAVQYMGAITDGLALRFTPVPGM